MKAIQNLTNQNFASLIHENDELADVDKMKYFCNMSAMYPRTTEIQPTHNSHTQHTQI